MTKIRSITVILGAVLIVLLLMRVFTVRTISLEPQACLNEVDIPLKGKLIFGVSQKELEAKLKSRFPCLSALKLEKKYPHTIKLFISASEPSVELAGVGLYLTPEGLVSSSSAANVPLLYFSTQETITAGQKVTDERLIFAAQLAKLLKKSDFETTSLRIVDQDQIAVYNLAQTVVVFSPVKPAEEQVDSLQQVLAKSKISGEQIAKIDLRFNKPVIDFK